jgi:hypothetical protein
MATRTSKRIVKYGKVVLEKAEERVMDRNDISGNCKNSFAILNNVGKFKLKEIARDACVVLGTNDLEISDSINIMLDKELAEALLAENRIKVRKERDKKSLADDSEVIGLAALHSEDREKSYTPVGVDVIEHSTLSESMDTLVSPLVDFENQLGEEITAGEK